MKKKDIIKIKKKEIIEIVNKYNSFGEELFDANGNFPLSENEKELMRSRLEEKFAEILDILRISKEDPNCAGTPKRLSKMYVNEIFQGRFNPPPELTFFPNRKNVDNLVISKGIQVMSICSHHWQPIAGTCTIGYIPNKRVIGLSKISRIVEWFSRRGQIQEELGEQIADFLQELLLPKALGVVINARHYCMIARGVRGSEADTIMTTSVMRGYMLDDLNLRNEFVTLIEK
jgi:GTP cyclohydrolase IA